MCDISEARLQLHLPVPQESWENLDVSLRPCWHLSLLLTCTTEPPHGEEEENLQYWGADEDVCSVFWVQLLCSPEQVFKSWVELVIKVRWYRQLPQAAGCQVEISLCCDYSWKHEGQQPLLGGRVGSLIQETTTISLFLSAMVNQAPQGSPSVFSTLVLPLSLLRNLRCEETVSPGNCLQILVSQWVIQLMLPVTFCKARPGKKF